MKEILVEDWRVRKYRKMDKKEGSEEAFSFLLGLEVRVEVEGWYRVDKVVNFFV